MPLTKFPLRNIRLVGAKNIHSCMLWLGRKREAKEKSALYSTGECLRALLTLETIIILKGQRFGGSLFFREAYHLKGYPKTMDHCILHEFLIKVRRRTPFRDSHPTAAVTLKPIKGLSHFYERVYHGLYTGHRLDVMVALLNQLPFRSFIGSCLGGLSLNQLRD